MSLSTEGHMSASRLVVACIAAALALPVASIHRDPGAAEFVAGQVVDAVSNRPVGDLVVTSPRGPVAAARPPRPRSERC